MIKKNLSLHRLYLVVVSTLLAAILFPAGVLAQSASANVASPTIVVEIKCKPGTADRWQAEFEKEMLPAIQDVINNRAGIIKFTYMEPVLPASRYDFILIFEINTFGDLDMKKPWPHYLALARRVGEARSEQINNELNSFEEEVNVTVMRTFDGGK